MSGHSPQPGRWLAVKEDDFLKLDQFSETILFVHHKGKKRTAFIIYKNASETNNHLKLIQKKWGHEGLVIKSVCPAKDHKQLIDALGASRFQFNVRVYPSDKTVDLRISGKNGSLKARGLINESEKARTGPIKVLIVDDSKTVRKVLNKAIEKMEGFEAVAEAGNPLEVESLIREFKPDVMTLDMQMPEMNGDELLKTLPPEIKIPAVLVTSMNMDEGKMVFDALENGAVDYLKKPSLSELSALSRTLGPKLKVAAEQQSRETKTVQKRLGVLKTPSQIDPRRVVAIGSSTGGPEALSHILPRLPKNMPPIVIVQHIPKMFSKALADRLDKSCAFSVKEAEDGDVLKPGHAYVAPGERHLVIEAQGTEKVLRVVDGDLVSGHKPSVDHMMKSVAKNVGRNSIGVILTGMGRDGAKGLKEMRDQGAMTLTQSEGTCVVYGMPRVADQLGASEKSLDLDDIAEHILEKVQLSSRIEGLTDQNKKAS